MAQVLRIIRPVILAGLSGLLFTASAVGQRENPVYINDSPQAWELFQQARDQAVDNPSEAARLYQGLLDDFPLKLLPVSDAAEHQFTSVRKRVLHDLKSNHALLERYRLIQSAQAERMLNDGQLDQLAQTRSLTKSGLDAMLRLAQRDLESAHFQSAVGWIEQALEHPDLSGDLLVQAKFMRGLAAHYLDEPDRFQMILDSLAQLGNDGKEYSQSLERLAASGDRPQREKAITSNVVAPRPELDDLVAEAIWSVPLEYSLQRRKAAETIQDELALEAALEQNRLDTSWTTSSATVTGSVVYINDGITIVAVNRLTGRKLWSFSSVDAATGALGNVTEPLDLNVVTVREGSVVALTGYAQTRYRAQSIGMVCLEPETGALRWSTDFEGMVESTAGERLFPHGTPVIADGMAFIATRKFSPQLLTSTYVVALDLQTGAPKWIQYITSSGGLRSVPRPISSLVYEKGSLFISSGVGATAKIDPANGEILWLRRFNVPINPYLVDQARLPWEMMSPVITTRGLVSIQPDLRRVMLLDIETGDELESHRASLRDDWNLPRYLLTFGQYVYSVGSDIRAFRLDDLSTPVWQLPASSGDPRLMPSNVQSGLLSLELRGRVQMTDGALIVPTTDGTLIVDSETGQVRRTIGIRQVGNPLAIESQLFMACGDRLDAYMSFQHAQEMLHERISQTPTDPDPSLLLLRLGMRVRDLELCLDSADLAMKSINRLTAVDPASARAARAHHELFSLLIDLAASDVVSTRAEGEAVYATIGSVAVSPQQRVEHLLNYGSWLSEYSLDQSVETFQTILSNHELANTWREIAGHSRPSSAWAAQHLSDLVEERGEVIYAPQADYAAFRLQQLLAQAEPAVDELLALATEFPFAEASIKASQEAARLRIANNDARGALQALMSTYRVAPKTESAVHLLQQFISICQDSGWNKLAHDSLNHLIDRFGNVVISEEPEVLHASDWLAESQLTSANQNRFPSIADQTGDAVPIDGILLPYHPSTGRDMDSGKVLLQSDDSITLHDLETMNDVWTAPVEGSSPFLISDHSPHDPNVLLGVEFKTGNAKLLQFDKKNGDLRWSSPRIGFLTGEFSDEPADRLQIDRPVDDIEAHLFDLSETVALRGDAAVYLVQRIGGLAAFDGFETPLPPEQTWKRRKTFDETHLAAFHNAGIVLAGISHDNGRLNNGRVLLLDPATGNQLNYSEALDEFVRQSRAMWMVIAPLGQLVIGTADGIMAVDLFTGEPMWRNSTYSSLNSLHGWLVGEHVVVRGQRGELRTISVNDGKISDPFETPLDYEWEPQESELRQVIDLNGQVLVMYSQRVVRFDPASGIVTGADVITGQRNYRWLLPAKDRLVLISGRVEQVPIPNQPGRQTQHTYQIYQLSHNGKVLSDPLQLPPMSDRINDAVLIDNWLLVSNSSATLAIPMPVK